MIVSFLTILDAEHFHLKLSISIFVWTLRKEKRKQCFQTIGIRKFSQYIIKQQIKDQDYGDFW